MAQSELPAHARTITKTKGIKWLFRVGLMALFLRICGYFHLGTELERIDKFRVIPNVVRCKCEFSTSNNDEFETNSEIVHENTDLCRAQNQMDISFNRE